MMEVVIIPKKILIVQGIVLKHGIVLELAMD